MFQTWNRLSPFNICLEEVTFHYKTTASMEATFSSVVYRLMKKIQFVYSFINGVRSITVLLPILQA